jgi:hypothetical protein
MIVRPSPQACRHPSSCESSIELADLEGPDDGDQRDGALLGTRSGRGCRRERGEPSPAPAAACFDALQIEEEPAKYGRCRQKIRAADDVGHGLGRQRVDRPRRGDGKRDDRDACNDAAYKRVGKPDIEDVERKVDRMVAARSIVMPEYCVVEQVRQRRQGTVQTRLALRPPVRVIDDEADVFGCRLVHARVEQDQALVVERKTGGEGIGVRERREKSENEKGRKGRRGGRGRTGGMGRPSSACGLVVSALPADPALLFLT